MFRVRHERFVYHNEMRSVGCCDVDVFDNSGQTVVVFTEISGNPGPSVTNAIECIISQYSKMRDLDKEDVLFIERYETHPENLDAVALVNEFGEEKPNWRRLSPNQASVILQALDT